MLINFNLFILLLKVFPNWTRLLAELDNFVGQNVQASTASIVVEDIQGINDFSLVVLYKTSEKSLGSCGKDSHRLSLIQCSPLRDHGNQN